MACNFRASNVSKTVVSNKFVFAADDILTASVDPRSRLGGASLLRLTFFNYNHSQ